MKLLTASFSILFFFLLRPVSSMAQTDFCTQFNAVKQTMEGGFSKTKGAKITESTKDYGTMLLTTKKWANSIRFPDAITADLTEILRVAPDPKNAGHNIYISFNLAHESSRAIAEAAFNKMKEKIKPCAPANWKLEERSGTTYARYTLMDGTFYDVSPHKISLQFNKLEGPGDKYTCDLIFDCAIK